jgi:uncharacterized protein YbaR (Trm112 family)
MSDKDNQPVENIDAGFLALLACPDNHLPLRAISPQELEGINAQISSGTLYRISGELVTAPLSRALIREDGKRVYEIRNGLPILLIESGIALT